MKLSHCSHESVLYVAKNMRERDREEIYGTRFEDNPFHLTYDVMAQSSFAWVAWRDELPAVVIGAGQRHPGVWSVFCFGTDQFGRVAIDLTRFVTKQMVPKLFEIGAHRLECDSHIKHTDAHRWLKICGAWQEGVKRGYGRDGSDYLTFVIRR